MTDFVVAPPNTLRRIHRMFAYLSKDAAGNEGVCAGPMGGLPLVPLIAADEERLASLTPIAEQIAAATGMTIVLVEFTGRIEHRTITGRSDA
ncbi:MAG: hypothetical protein IT481_08720 [Gammaproteobacteria bacterium]|nr:hypothetical protein [Gammaproteobacteria bacterium]